MDEHDATSSVDNERVDKDAKSSGDNERAPKNAASSGDDEGASKDAAKVKAIDKRAYSCITSPSVLSNSFSTPET